jgi:C1A family cysteine protease
MKRSVFTLFAAALLISILVSCSKENASMQVTQDVPQYSLGCQFLPAAEYQAIPLAIPPEYNLKALPSSITLPSPPVGNQGGEGSCVGLGTGYECRSVDWYITNNNTSYTFNANIFSPAYVYNQIKISTCASGAYVTSGLNLLQSQGVCTWQSMPYVDGACYTMPNTAQKTEAANYKITSYSRITINTSTIKTFLANHTPVVVAGPVNMAFELLGNGQVLGKFSGRSLGGHCYCLVGYDDSKGAFKFENSWGTSWASQGYGWISYTYIGTWWQEAYVVHTTLL